MSELSIPEDVKADAIFVIFVTSENVKIIQSDTWRKAHLIFAGDFKIDVGD